ncbi:MAG: hypothetical protein EXQ56_08145 [Acidobacteria bacterium]|nr:hypothetical protein [Acidobacteriota bacterium]
MKRWGLRVFLALAGLIYLRAVVFSSLGTLALEHPTTDNLRRGIRWDPDNPFLWRYLARTRLLSLDNAELNEGAEAYRQALVRNPLDPLAWEGLAAIESRLGDSQKQEAVLRGWLTALPHSPSAAWALANLLLQQGRAEEAYPYFRSAAADDTSLRTPLFDLSGKLLSDPQRILAEMIPPDLSARIAYCYYLIGKPGMLREVYPVWRTLLPTRTDVVISFGLIYVEALAAAGMGAEAARVWQETLAESIEGVHPPAGERIINGGYEAPLRNAGLDWRLTQASGHQITLDNFAAQSGSRSLRVKFDGKTNPEFSHVQQWIPVEPGRDYRFQAYLKTQDISTDNGLYLSLVSIPALPENSPELLTETLVGTSPWTAQQIDFQTGPNTSMILVRLRRNRSSKLNNLLQGTVWLDDVSLLPKTSPSLATK